MTPQSQEQLIDQFDHQYQALQEKEPVGPAGADASTQKEWNLLQTAVDAIRHHALVQQVKAVRNQVEGSAPTIESNDEVSRRGGASAKDAQPAGAVIRRILPGALKVAAILIALLSIVGLGKVYFTSSKDIYDKYYTPYELGATRGESGEDKLTQYYQLKDWKGVEHVFDTTMTKTGKDYFLSAMAEMQQQNYTQAIVNFSTLMGYNATQKEPYFQDEAEYYLAMCYLATNQTSQALPLLNRIASDPANVYNAKVRKMSGLDLWILRAK
jgi:hypothetical protein